MLFGYPGIAIPSPLTLTVSFEKDKSKNTIEVLWTSDQSLVTSDWDNYVRSIVNHCEARSSIHPGTLTIKSEIPLGKGMGSSTALVIAITRCLLSAAEVHEPLLRDAALQIEDAMNPGHSGIDFAVIWNNVPIKFQKGSEPEIITLPQSLTKLGMSLIDTGMPDQQTPELIAWITERKDELRDVFADIGTCTERLLAGEDLIAVIRDHNKAQQSLGVVTEKAKDLIKKIEQEGGAAKVLGAGSRSGGCGMVLAINIDASAIPADYPVIPLTPNY